MKAAVLTTQSDCWKNLGDVVIPNMQAYCDKQGYGWLIDKIPPAFEFYKINAIIAALQNFGYDLVLCLDLDTLITNHNVKVEDFVDSGHDFYITQDINEINAGAVIVRKSGWSINMLHQVLESKAENEQNALKPFMNDPKVKILPHPSINSYPYDEYAPSYGLIPGRTPLLGIEGKPTHEQGNWERGDFIMHLPGLTNARRIEIFNRTKEQIIL